MSSFGGFGGFGNNTNNTNTNSSTPSIFGATNTAAGGTPTQAQAPASGGAFSNLGGNNTGAGNAAAPAKPSLFGGSAFGSSNTSNNVFGSTAAPAASSSSTEPPKTQSLFGGGSTFGQAAPKPAEGATPPATGFGAGFFKPQANPGASTTPTTPFASSPASGSIFGAQAPKPPATQSNTPAPPSLFPSLNNPAGDNAAAPAAGGLFGSKPAAPAPALGGGLFGSKPSDQQPAPVASATPGTSSIFGASKPADTAAKPPSGGLNFFSNPSSAAASKPADNATPAAAPNTGTLGGGLFGAKPATSSATPAAGTTPAATTTPAAGGLFGAGLPAKPAEKKDGAAPAAPSLFGGGLFGAKPTTPSTTGEKKEEEKKDTAANPAASSTLGLSALGGSTAPNIAVAPPSTLRGKTIDEIVNKWTGELEVHVKEFNKFAGEVGAWDRALIENGNNLARLYNQVLVAEREQQDVDNALDHIEQQQKAISSTLEEYEKLSQDIFGGSERGNHAVSIRALDSGPADTERDKNYMLATDLQAQLDDLAGSLTQMIDSVNELSLPSSSNGNASEDPLSQIATILSTHLESLQWIDGAVREVDSNIAEAERRVERSSYANGRSGSLGASRGFGSTR